MVELDALRSGRPGTSEEYLDVYHWLCEESRGGDCQKPGALLVLTNSIMGTRGVSASEADATFTEMDHSGSNLMTVAKMQHYVQIRAGNE